MYRYRVLEKNNKTSTGQTQVFAKCWNAVQSGLIFSLETHETLILIRNFIFKYILELIYGVTKHQTHSELDSVGTVCRAGTSPLFRASAARYRELYPGSAHQHAPAETVLCPATHSLPPPAPLGNAREHWTSVCWLDVAGAPLRSRANSLISYSQTHCRLVLFRPVPDRQNYLQLSPKPLTAFFQREVGESTNCDVWGLWWPYSASVVCVICSQHSKIYTKWTDRHTWHILIQWKHRG